MRSQSRELDGVGPNAPTCARNGTVGGGGESTWRPPVAAGSLPLEQMRCPTKLISACPERPLPPFGMTGYHFWVIYGLVSMVLIISPPRSLPDAHRNFEGFVKKRNIPQPCDWGGGGSEI